jgi:hypothetical protein
MTSASGADEPEESEDEDQVEQQMQQQELTGPQAAARATRVEQELAQARSFGPHNGDWELDWLPAGAPA